MCALGEGVNLRSLTGKASTLLNESSPQPHSSDYFHNKIYSSEETWRTQKKQKDGKIHSKFPHPKDPIRVPQGHSSAVGTLLPSLDKNCGEVRHTHLGLNIQILMQMKDSIYTNHNIVPHANEGLCLPQSQAFSKDNR